MVTVSPNGSRRPLGSVVAKVQHTGVDRFKPHWNSSMVPITGGNSR
jgi:hypothetical protein